MVFESMPWCIHDNKIFVLKCFKFLVLIFDMFSSFQIFIFLSKVREEVRLLTPRPQLPITTRNMPAEAIILAFIRELRLCRCWDSSLNYVTIVSFHIIYT
jgi:hypothetical protein